MSKRDRYNRMAVSRIYSERPQNTSMSIISSMGEDMKSANSKVNGSYEDRDQMIFLPYGLSSSIPTGVRAQTIMNENGNNAVVGIYDPDRPTPEFPGELVLYSSGGARIFLNNDGSICIYSSGGRYIFIDDDNVSIESDDVIINGYSFRDTISRIEALESMIPSLP